MILVPLPFFVSFLLLILLVRTLRREEDEPGADPLFVALIAAYGVQSILVGLRWGYDLRAVLPAMSVLAALVAPLAWLSFESLARRKPPRRAAIAPHLLPAALVAVLLVLRPDPVGAVIIVTFAAYGAALLWRARLGPDGLVASRLDGVLRSHRALQITGGALLASAGTDIVISLDLAWGGGAHSGAVVAAGNVIALLVLGAAASVAGASRVEPEPARLGSASQVDPEPGLEPEAAKGSTSEDRAVARLVEGLMREQALYRDVDLNLDRIARRLRLPSRDVSRAINRLHGMSVSQYVNTNRVDHACRLLRESEEPITRVMFEAGFGTKSNFNREFLRVTATTPSAYRRAHTAPAAVPSAGAPRGPIAETV